MHKNVKSIKRAMGRDQPKTPEPMRSTLPNTGDQPRIPHSEYHGFTNCLTLSRRPLIRAEWKGSSRGPRADHWTMSPSRYEEEEAIRALANRKAVGPDGLPAELLKVLADEG